MNNDQILAEVIMDNTIGPGINLQMDDGGMPQTIQELETAVLAMIPAPIPGPQGVKGDTGTAGAAGPTGPQGLAGTTGAQGIPGVAGPTGPTGATGTTGPTGAVGATGPAGAAGVNAFSAAAGRALSLATAYQALDPTKPAAVTITLQAQSSISLGGAVNNEGAIVMGATSAVAAGTGTTVATYKNNLGGTLVVGLNLNSTQANTYTIAVPIGYYFAIRQTAGAGLTILSAYDQAIG